MKSYPLSFFALVMIVFVSSFNLADSQAATIAHWDFEDGTDGMPFSDMPSGGVFVAFWLSCLTWGYR